MFWRRKQRDFSAEIEAHLSHEIDRLRSEPGVSDEEARAVARRAFGNLSAAEETFYEASRWMWWDHLRNDLRYALRLMARDLRLTAIIVITLALGIAANSIIFSAVRAVLLRPLPYRQPDRLVQVWDSGPRSGGESDWVSFPDFRDWRASNRVFEEMAAWRFAILTLSGGREPEAIPGLEVTDRLFTVLGVKPALGRTFLPGEDRPGRETVAVISHGLWQRRFGSDAGVAGSRVNIAGKPYTIIGVMPPQFRFPSSIPGDNDVVPIDLWIPMRAVPDLEERGSHNFWVVARLKKSVSLSQSQANMDAVAANLARQYPNTNKDMGATVLGLQHHLTSAVAPVLAILLAAVGLVMLLVCANVAGLLLSRAQVRSRELAIRASLGAGRGRLIRQVLTESMLLAAFGATTGLVVARFGATLLVKFGPENIPRLSETAIDGQVALFTAAVALVAGLLCGVAPALLAGGSELHRSLKEAGARATASRRSLMARSLLVAAEMALAVVLLTGAGLLIRSFLRVIHVDPGFRAANVLSVIVGLPDSRYSDASKQTAFFEELVRRLRATRGIETAAVSDSVPLSGSNDQGAFRIEGRPEPKSVDDGPQANRPRVSSEYFATMGIPLLRGRLFNERDRAGSADVAVISDLAARIYWPGEDPIGRRVCVDWAANGRPIWREIVGIVGSTRHFGLEARQKAEIYLPHAQLPSQFMFLLVRFKPGQLTATAAAIRHEITGLDPDLAGIGFRSMDELIGVAESRRRFQVILMVWFSGLAVVLAAIGIYGMMVNTVVRRTREIGLRLALGAAPRDAVTMILSNGMVLAGAGIAAGLVAAIALMRFIRTLLFGVSPFDVPTFMAVVVLLVLIAFVSAWAPAHAAARVDPAVALREE
jgi:putative ABC transport system permease protein